MNVTGASAASSLLSASSNLRPDRQKMMQPVADLLGMSVDDLRKAQRGGTTLDQLASSKGVSHADLVAAIKKGLQDARPAGATPPAAADGTDPLDKMAEDIAAGRRPQRAGGHRRHGDGDGDGDDAGGAPSSGGDTDSLNALSSSLKMSSSDLVTALKSGTSLTDLAARQGVNAGEVLDAVGKGLVLKTYA